MARLRKLEYGSPVDQWPTTLRLGIEKGFFEEEGLDLSIRVIFGGPPLAAALNAGEVQIGEIGSPPGLTALSHGAQFKIIGGGTHQKLLFYLGVRSDIQDFQGLKGKRFGLLSMGSCDEWVGRAMFLKGGLDPDRDITFIPLLNKYSQILPLMREGEVDAVLGVEPDLALGESQGLLRTWAGAYEESYLPRFQWSIIVAQNDFIEREPEVIQALLRAYQRSAHYAAEHVDEWVDFVSRWYRIDRAVAQRAVARDLPQFHLDCQIDLVGLQKVIELQQRMGVISRSLSAEEVVNLQFMPHLSEPVGAH